MKVMSYAAAAAAIRARARSGERGQMCARTWKGHAAQDEASRVERNAFVKGLKTRAVRVGKNKRKIKS
jgi:hypothetical protein